MLISALFVQQPSSPKPVYRLHLKPGKEPERAKQPLPELFRGALKVKGIDLPLSLRHVKQVASEAATIAPQKQQDSAFLSLTERTLRVPHQPLPRKSISTILLEVSNAELPHAPLLRGSEARTRPKSLLQLRSQLQLYRYGIECSSGHRIRQINRSKPSLRPLLV